MGEWRATRRSAAALAVVLVVALSACGGAGTSTTSEPTLPPSTTSPTASGLTQVLTFQVFDDKGVLPGFVQTGTVSGTCAGGSVAAPGRADAWRCAAGGQPLDPCFSTEAGGDLACAAEPFSHNLTMLHLAGPLPRGNRTDPSLLPWFLELADGSRCGPAGADATARDPAARYACPSGATVDGDPDRSHPVWTAQVRPPAGGASAAVAVTTAWY